jgi:hypothetical protein
MSGTTVYRVEHPSDGRGPFAREALPFDGYTEAHPGTRFRGSLSAPKGWCDTMHDHGHKSAFRDPWAVACYFWLRLPDLAALGYVVAEYAAPVVREDHTSQCLIPVTAEPVRRVPLLDLPALATASARGGR